MSAVWKPVLGGVPGGEPGGGEPVTGAPTAWQRGWTPPPGSWPKMTVSPSHVNAAEWPVGLSTLGAVPAISGTTRL